MKPRLQGREIERIQGKNMLKVCESESADRWVYVYGECSIYDPDEFVELVKEYQKRLSGKIKHASEHTQYYIDNDPLRLVFQWDSLFGIVVIVPRSTNMDVAKTTLREICDVINQRESGVK